MLCVAFIHCLLDCIVLQARPHEHEGSLCLFCVVFPVSALRWTGGGWPGIGGRERRQPEVNHHSRLTNHAQPRLQTTTTTIATPRHAQQALNTVTVSVPSPSSNPITITSTPSHSDPIDHLFNQSHYITSFPVPSPIPSRPVPSHSPIPGAP